MPFMYGDAVVETDNYDIILQGKPFDYTLFYKGACDKNQRFITKLTGVKES